MKKKNYYFDNSTTSFPKPKEVAKEMSNFIMNIGGTYGRVNTERGKETTKNRRMPRIARQYFRSKK